MTFPPIYFFAQLFRIVRTGSGSCVLLSLCSLLLSQQVTAGINQWTTNGPLSKPFTPTTFVIDPLTPTTLYAGTSFQGIFKSDNGGASWTPHNTDSFTRPDALVIDPLTPSTLYAVASDDVFKSIDGGGSWTAVNTGFPELPEFPHPPAIFTLVIHPLTPTTLYAVSFFPFLGLFKTTDRATNIKRDKMLLERREAGLKVVSSCHDGNKNDTRDRPEDYGVDS